MVTDVLRSRPHAAAGGGWLKRSTTLERLYPHLATNAVLVPGAAAYAFGAYAQLTAAAAAAYLPIAAHCTLRASAPVIFTGLHFMEVEIATGAAGAEVLHSRFAAALGIALNVAGVTASLSAGLTIPLDANTIPSGTRIAARVRASNPFATISSHVGLYLTGYDNTAPASDVSYPLDPHLNNADTAQSLVTPWGAVLTVTAAAYPAYGAWVQVVAAAPSDLLIHGVAHGIQPFIGIEGFHLQLGIGAAGAEVPYAVIGLPDTPGFGGGGTQLLRRPLLVKSGERLAVRAATTGVVTVDINVLYEQI